MKKTSNLVNAFLQWYLRVQNKAVIRKLLQKTRTSRHDMKGRWFVAILRVSQGTGDRKHGNTSALSAEQAVHCRHRSVTVNHSRLIQTRKNWTNCLEVCCLTVMVNPWWAQQHLTVTEKKQETVITLNSQKDNRYTSQQKTVAIFKPFLFGKYFLKT